MVLIMPDDKLNELHPKLVSVPSRGLWFLSETETDEYGTTIQFPSPYGDYGSYRNHEVL